MPARIVAAILVAFATPAWPDADPSARSEEEIGLEAQRARAKAAVEEARLKALQAAAAKQQAAEAKKATDIKVLDLTGITSFADFFVICTGANARQIQAISDEVNLQLKRQAGELPISVEGYNQAEWVLADYGDLLVHIFSPKSRDYYDLERLWRNAQTIEIPPE